MFLRGTNSYQTSVNWNGFLLNSLTLGTMDLSAIPTAAAEDISVVHGASGTIAGSGNFGGAILLHNKADWNNKLHIGLQSELGTYDNRHFSFTGKVGNPWVQYQVLLFSHQAENNFRYTDIFKMGNPVDKIKNNALDNKGFIQNLFIRLPKSNNLETGIWYQVRQKQIPAIMGSYLPAKAMQNDSSLRIYAKWTKLWDRSSFSIGTAVFDELMQYRDRSIPSTENYYIDSKIKTSRLMGDLNYRIWLLHFLSADGGMSFSSLSANVDAYGQKINENQLAAITAMKLSLSGFTGNVSARKEFHSSTDIPFMLAFGASKDLPLKGMAIKFSYADQFRVPAFNDKYWQPGGNPDLLPESGFTTDMGVMQDFNPEKDNELILELNAYYSVINNMIQWIPSGTGTWWKPENRREVTVRGLEASVSAAVKVRDYRFGFNGCYNFSNPVITKTYNGNDANTGNKLSYVPSSTASASTSFESKKLYLGLTGNFTSNRYTGDDNNPVFMMPSFLVFNGYAGYQVKAGDVSGRLQFKVMNLFNREYMAVRSYPMPGRTIHISFSFDFSANNT